MGELFAEGRLEGAARWLHNKNSKSRNALPSIQQTRHAFHSRLESEAQPGVPTGHVLAEAVSKAAL
jgi:hypothetical protein